MKLLRETPQVPHLNQGDDDDGGDDDDEEEEEEDGDEENVDVHAIYQNRNESKGNGINLTLDDDDNQSNFHETGK